MPLAAGLYYFVHEPDNVARPPVILIHGAGGHHLYWPPQIRRLQGERIIAGAKAEVDQEVFRAKEQLRTQVSAIALEGAGKILGREIDAKAHNDLLDKLAAEL